MVVVAIAGGYGDLGRTIVEAVSATGKHVVCILARKSRPNLHLGKVLETDYSSIPALKEQLQSCSVNVVISALNLHWPGASDAQLNLIKAAAACETVQGFIPSEFNIDYSVPENKMPYRVRESILAATDELRQHIQLSFTLIRCGFFLDYLGLPNFTTNLHPLYCLLDLPNSVAVIPGNGQAEVVFTLTRDVAKFTAALLDVNPRDWPEEATVVGEKVRLSELVKIVESTQRRAFEVSYDSLASLRENGSTELPSNRSVYQYFPGGRAELDTILTAMMIGMAEGVFDIGGRSLNKMFPELTATGVESFLKGCASVKLYSGVRKNH